jgi:nicotinate phosphoribosyltransferase
MIIESLLDTDLYKLTMMQVVLHQFPSAIVDYKFKCRNTDVDLRPYADEIQGEIKAFCQLRMTPEELQYLSSLAYIKSDFIDFLRLFQASEGFIQIETDPEFCLRIRGPWLHTILFEVPILAIISEVYFRNRYPKYDLSLGRQRLADKVNYLQAQDDNSRFVFSDFGTRRRFSRHWHAYVVGELQANLAPFFAGTSNVGLARQYNLVPIGTMAHEYIQACQSLGPRLLYSQKFAFEKWAQEYRGDLGIALSDTYSTDAFLNDFDLYFCKLFDGARQDSGDPIEWGERLIAHYQRHKIDPRQKTMVFSDGLNFETAFCLYRRFIDRSKPAFGIGTYLSHDVGLQHLDIVLKMVRCNDQPVAKVSEAPGKTMCEDESYLHYLRTVFKINA